MNATSNYPLRFQGAQDAASLLQLILTIAETALLTLRSMTSVFAPLNTATLLMRKLDSLNTLSDLNSPQI